MIFSKYPSLDVYYEPATEFNLSCLTIWKMDWNYKEVIFTVYGYKADLIYAGLKRLEKDNEIL